jgi:hypothetical protein
MNLRFGGYSSSPSGQPCGVTRISYRPWSPISWYAGTAALVVLYHSLEHVVDVMRGAWRKSVTARTESAAEGVPEPAARSTTGE